MRMIGIGLMGFLLAGVALLLSTLNILEQGHRYVRDLTSGPQLVFEHRIPATAQDAHRAVILRANPDHPVILSGLPAYQGVTFKLPVDARSTSGYLQIDATSQILDGLEGVLRISINNTRRGEMLLRSGEAERSLQIALSPADFAGPQLVVSFSLQGIGPQQRCVAQDGVEAVVEIETTSAVYLTLDRPLESARDQLHAWGNMVKVAWPAWLRRDEQLRRLVLATQFQRRGLATVFAAAQSEHALTTVDLRTALSAFPAPLARPQAPGHLTQIGLRRFHRQTAWRERYDLVGSAGHNIPTQLDLHVLLGRQIGDQPWALTVTLNNRLVFQDHVTGAHSGFRALIDLPADSQAATNTLDVVATTTAPQNGLCDQGPELVAEMLPDTRLILGDTPFADSLSQVHDALHRIGPVNVAMTSALTAIDADIASRMLDHVIPFGVDIKPVGAKAHVTVLSADHPAPSIPNTGPVWLVTPGNGAQSVSVRELHPGEALPRTGLAMLVTPSAVTLAEAEG